MDGRGEFSVIDALAKILGPNSARTTLGIGDDAAIIDGSKLLCSDCLVEGVHFDLKMTKPEDVGYKAVAACLSDIAAMGGKPIAVTVSLALPKERLLLAEKFYRGIEQLRLELKTHANFDVVGGDLSSSPQTIFIDVTAYGEAPHPILRSGARPGDIIAISGHPGSSAAGLYSMKNWTTIKELSGLLMNAHNRPKPRFDLDTVNATSLIDTSDGLASEANHLANASRVDIEIDQISLPILERVEALAKRADESSAEQQALDWALYGGEDYELLATFPIDSQLPPGFTAIGRVLKPANGAKSTVTLVKNSGEREPLEARGYNHFS